jgi:hypothetical protein
MGCVIPWIWGSPIIAKDIAMVFNLLAITPDLAIGDGTLSGYNNGGNLDPG